MKIYQESSFEQVDNKTICTIKCKFVPYLCGKAQEDRVVEFSVKDQAKCHPDDEFDKKFGEHLAERRASVKVFAKVKQILNEYAKRLCFEVTDLNADLAKIEFMLDKSIMDTYMN